VLIPPPGISPPTSCEAPYGAGKGGTGMSVYELTMRGQFQGQAVRNVFLFYHPTMSPAILQATWDEIEANWNSTLKLRVSSGYTIPEYSWRRVDLPGYPEVPVSLETALIGNAPDDVTASQMAIVASFYAGTPRPNRARKYFGGWTEGAMTGGLWVSSATDAVGAFCQNLINMYSNDPASYAQYVTGRRGSAPGDPTGPVHVVAWNPVDGRQIASAAIQSQPVMVMSR